MTILKASETEAVTLVAYDATQGQINRSSGAISFRLVDFFSGTDKEQVRLTEEGNLGIRTHSPQAKLDVAGVIRTSKGIEFENGTKLATTATGRAATDLGRWHSSSECYGHGHAGPISEKRDGRRGRSRQ